MERVVVYPISDRETIKKIKHRGEGSYWSYSTKFDFVHDSAMHIELCLSVLDFGPTYTKSGQACVILVYRGTPIVAKTSYYGGLEDPWDEDKLRAVAKDLLGSSKACITTILHDLGVLSHTEEIGFK